MRFIVLMITLSATLSVKAEAEPEPGQEPIPQDFYEFTVMFENTVRAKNYKDVYKLLNKEYRKEQLANLKGNKKQLIDELFSGNNEVGNWVNPEMTEIMNIVLMNVRLLENGLYQVYYEIELPDAVLEINLNLKTNEKFKKWGFVGAYG